jgi:hypothetical protein
MISGQALVLQQQLLLARAAVVLRTQHWQSCHARSRLSCVLALLLPSPLSPPPLTLAMQAIKSIGKDDDTQWLTFWTVRTQVHVLAT